MLSDAILFVNANNSFITFLNRKKSLFRTDAKNYGSSHGMRNEILESN